jgi:hypothetical protein
MKNAYKLKSGSAPTDSLHIVALACHLKMKSQNLLLAMPIMALGMPHDPAPALEPRLPPVVPDVCPAHNAVIQIIRLNGLASPFCSQLLSIGTKTVTSTYFSTPAVKTISTSSAETISTTLEPTFTTTNSLYTTETIFESTTFHYTETKVFNETSTDYSYTTDTATTHEYPTEYTTITEKAYATTTNHKTTTSTVLAETTVTAYPQRRRRDAPQLNIPLVLKPFNINKVFVGCSCLSLTSPTVTVTSTTTLPEQYVSIGKVSSIIGQE